MNCDTIDSILDDHRLARLSSAERQDVSAHLAGCGRCAGSWAAHDVLAREAVAAPPPELFGRVLGQLDAVRASSQANHRRRLLASAAAALTAVIAVAAAYTALDLGVAEDDGAATPTVAGFSPAPRFAAGRDYEVLAAAAPLPATADGVPVIEFFMWGCYGCYFIEAEVVRWSAEAAGRVALTRVPAIFNREAELHARAFYTAEALGKLDDMHAAFFDEIHVRGNRLASRESLVEFFGRFGVDGATFAAAFDSRAVDASLERAVELSREYSIGVTPSFVVAGRYVTSPSLAGPNLLAVVDQLVADETPCKSRCNGGARPPN